MLGSPNCRSSIPPLCRRRGVPPLHSRSPTIRLRSVDAASGACDGGQSEGPASLFRRTFHARADAALVLTMTSIRTQRLRRQSKAPRASSRNCRRLEIVNRLTVLSSETTALTSPRPSIRRPRGCLLVPASAGFCPQHRPSLSKLEALDDLMEH